MYEENLKPLPEGDFAKVFADLLADIERNSRARPPEKITPANVVQWANMDVQPSFARICRRLLLPGSGIVGTENLAELTSLALAGSSCILCLNHRSNFDVPTLYALLEDQTLSTARSASRFSSGDHRGHFSTQSALGVIDLGRMNQGRPNGRNPG